MQRRLPVLTAEKTPATAAGLCAAEHVLTDAAAALRPLFRAATVWPAAEPPSGR